jgi:hypothetical protein
MENCENDKRGIEDNNGFPLELRSLDLGKVEVQIVDYSAVNPFFNEKATKPALVEIFSFFMRLDRWTSTVFGLM